MREFIASVAIGIALVSLLPPDVGTDAVRWWKVCLGGQIFTTCLFWEIRKLRAK